MKSGDNCPKCKTGWMKVYSTRRLKDGWAQRFLKCDNCGETGSQGLEHLTARAPRKKRVCLSGTKSVPKQCTCNCTRQTKGDNPSIPKTNEVKTMLQSQVDLELLAVRVADDKNYFLDEADVCEKYGCTPLKLWKWIRKGLFPLPLKVGDALRWGLKQLSAWESEIGMDLIEVAESDEIENTKHCGAEWTPEPLTKI